MYIISPKSRKKIFLDNGISSYEDRLKEVLEKGLTDEIVAYCQDNATIKSSRQILSYETAEHILENLATYLLLGEYKENNIMTPHQIKECHDREIQASNSDSNAEDLIYGTSGQIDDNVVHTISASSELVRSEVTKDPQMLSEREIEKVEKKKAKARKRYKDSKTYRMEKMYGTRPVRTYRLKRVYDVDESGKKKAAKNVFGQPIWDVEYITIGGKTGLIDPDKPYKWSWATVDTDGNFSFLGVKYTIDMKENPQYTVGEDNKCQMDKVLCYQVDGKNYFFDQDIKELTKGIKQV